MMKTSASCDCPAKPNCIVITIETCCRRTCEAYQKGQGEKLKDDSDKVSEGSKENLRETSLHPLEDKEETQIGDTGIKLTDEVVSGHPESDHSPPLVLPSTESKDVDTKEHRFKLPVVLERHHGPGCAMEINVLEKHESNCVYKKEDIGGRNNADDKVGSYDCIGRLVFRTCNSNELDSDTSKLGIHGNLAGQGPGDTRKPGSRDKTSGSGHRSVQMLDKPGSGDKTPAGNHKSDYKDESRQQMAQSPQRSDFQQPSLRSNLAVAGSTSTQISGPKKNVSSELFRSTVEERSITSQDNINSKSREEQVMIAATTTFLNASKNTNLERTSLHESTKRHYPGDGCKLHPPRNPVFFHSNRLLERASVSKKVFPVYADEANQTDTQEDVEGAPKITFSQETITSLTELAAKPPEIKRKSKFLGSLFGRNPGRTKATDSKRMFRKKLDDTVN